ncbi:DUF2285 domain-containing protein [Paracoccus sp. P2]|uniref:DUF2285 domain-containing protein n=1 Tax=Paracoccus sp. P2 TaxID=3248840 RepID=UPI00391F2BAA
MPQEDTSSILLAPAPPVLEDSLGHVPAIWRVHLPADGADGDFRFDLGNGQTLQILDGAVSGEAIAVAVVPLGLDGFDRIEAIRRFLSALHGRAIPPDTRLTRQQRARLQRMLRAFDGYRAGATQQEIAQVILNTERLDREEWQASSARHTIKALLRDARAMVAGGYRKLLRHRHPG